MRHRPMIVLAFAVGTILGSAGMRMISQTLAAPPPSAAAWKAIAVAAAPNGTGSAPAAWFVGADGTAQWCYQNLDPQQTPSKCVQVPFMSGR